MNPCPYCQAPDRQVKNGSNASGSQRWECQRRGRKYTPEPKEHGYPDSQRQQAVKMSVDGLNYRRIARFLGVDHKTVIHWVKAHPDQLPPAPVAHDLNNVELDELFTHIEQKKTSST